MKKYISFSDNLRLAYFHCPNLRSVSVGVFVNTGSANEIAELSGISHAVEHMVFKGTKHISAIELSQKGDLLGGRINAATSVYSTIFYGTVIDSLTEECFALISELTTEPTFPAAEWKKEKNVILEELSMSEDDYEDLAYENLMKNAYPDSSIGMPVIGTAENIKRFTATDIRNYYKERYTSGNIVIVVTGNVTFERACELTEKYFVGKFAFSPKCEAFVEPEFKLVAKQNIDVKNSSQANLVIGFPAFDMYDDRFYALATLDGVLGEGMSSKLFVNLREKKGLCYSVYSFKNCNRHNGLFCVYVGTNASQIADAITEIKKTLNEVIEQGITDTEFKCTKALRNTAFTLSFESSLSILRALGRYALHHDELFDFDKEFEKYNSVTPEDTISVLKNLDFTNVQISYVGESIDLDLLEVFRGK